MQQLAILHINNILKDVKFKELLVKKINEHVDIPMINEDTEEKVFTAILDIVVSTMQALSWHVKPYHIS